MLIREAEETDLSGILAIYNDAVLTTTAIWNEAVVDLSNRHAWLNERRQQCYPVLVAIENNEVLGYASFGDFRAWQGYRYTVEHSVYVKPGHRRSGMGTALLASLIERARLLKKHVMIGGIEGSNEASLKLHARLGFRIVGRLEQVGTKFGRWLDLVFVQHTLTGDQAPEA
jgi:phosphinothricin acetyltransferase